MKDLAHAHRNHVIIQSEVIFLKKEIEFLLKILRIEHSQTIHLEKMKILDAYWRSFENKIIDLNRILVRIVQGEKEIVENYRQGNNELKEHVCPENELRDVKQEIMTLKDSFYDYLHEEGFTAIKSK